MKAIVCEGFGPIDQLQYKEIKDPIPGKNQVVVDMRACSVNFPDTLIVQGKYQMKPDLPFSPGSDIAGVVSRVGEEVEKWKEGDAVFGFTRVGGFAEKIVVNQYQIFPKPPEMPFDIAASFLMAYGTSYHALKDRAILKKGETVVVLGASGGVGLAAVELSKMVGAKVIAAASTEKKLSLCQRYGADEIINYEEEDLKNRIKELTDGKGADIVYDPVGGKYSEPALRAMAPGGRFLVVGFAAGDIPKIPLNLPLLKICSVVGVFWGRFSNEQPKKSLQNSRELIEMFQAGKLQPHISQTFSLKNAVGALQKIQQRTAMGKLVITNL